MKDQSPIQDRLLEYAYGELSEAESKEVERQLAGDARLAQELAKVRSVRAAVASLPRPMPRADITATILRRGRELAPQPKPMFSWASVFWRPSFAGGALSAAASGWTIPIFFLYSWKSWAPRMRFMSCSRCTLEPISFARSSVARIWPSPDAADWRSCCID